MAYMDVLNTARFTVGVFLLSKGAVLPLHNHPDMSVVRSVPGRVFVDV